MLPLRQKTLTLACIRAETALMTSGLAGQYLYVEKSTLRREGTYAPLEAGRDDGLFSSCAIASGQQVGNTFFVGKFVNAANYRLREAQGKGSYAHKISVDEWYDCFDEAMDGRCLLSKANAPLHCVIFPSLVSATANCEIHINPRTKKIRLLATKNIEPNEEILFNYGSGFWR